MKQRTRLSEEQQQAQQAGSGEQTRSAAGREFANADELLRHDAAQTNVPPEIARRLQKSAADLSGPKTSWWQRDSIA